MKSKKMTQVDWVKQTYVKPTPLTNTQRQAAYKARLQRAAMERDIILDMIVLALECHESGALRDHIARILLIYRPDEQGCGVSGTGLPPRGPGGLPCESSAGQSEA